MMVYVAAGFSEKAAVREIQRRLRESGHEVTVDWTEHPDVAVTEREQQAATIAADVARVAAADVFVLLAEPVTGRAKHVELGIALHAQSVTGSPEVYVVGRDTGASNFFFHPVVQRRRTIDDVLAELDPAAPVVIVALPPRRWPEYRRLRLEALRREPAAFTTTLAQAAAYPDDFWHQRLTAPAAIHRVAEANGRLVGMAAAIPAGTEDPAVALIVSVYVARANRGRGVGRRLIEALLAELRRRDGIVTARLWVNEGQEAALALYRSLGFAVVGHETPAGTPPAPQLIMERSLP